jgi:predicted lactoylglutathione lyase
VLEDSVPFTDVPENSPARVKNIFQPVPGDPPHLSHVPGDPPQNFSGRPVSGESLQFFNDNSVPISAPDSELTGGPDPITTEGVSEMTLTEGVSEMTLTDHVPGSADSISTVTVTNTAAPTITAEKTYNLRRNRSSWKGRVFISSQLSRKQAADKFGDQALRAQMKELMQMRDLDVMYPINFHALSRDQRRKVIRSHMIFQPKYDPNTGEFIKLKARFVADGSTQDKSLYEDVSSPTVSTHAVFINAAIAAKERRIVKVVDLPGAYLHADMSGEEVLMHISKEDAEIMIMMDAKYKQFLREDGSMVVKLSKALYGCIESAKLWYAEISKTFRSIGYTCNPKDICVFNKTVNGVQCTITLHVDDLMVTSVIESLIDEVMNALRKHYERDGAVLDVKVGKIHNYLGMTFDFSIDGQVLITMNKYVRL